MPLSPFSFSTFDCPSSLRAEWRQFCADVFRPHGELDRYALRWRGAVPARRPWQNTQALRPLRRPVRF